VSRRCRSSSREWSRWQRGLAHAEYAIVESTGGAVSVTLKRVPVDRGALITTVERWDNPLRDRLLQQYRS
jgi:hypothetical protein